MSKRSTIYAAAITPIRKRFGCTAKEVGDHVNSMLSDNERLRAKVDDLTGRLKFAENDAETERESRSRWESEAARLSTEVESLRTELGEMRVAAVAPVESE